MQVSPLAGKPANQNILVNIPGLVAAYYTGKPDPSVKTEKVWFGTSGYRGSSFKNSFNENHILEAKATPEQKEKLSRIFCGTASKITRKELAGENINSLLTKAPGNNAAIGGIKVVTKNGWFAARLSGTEDIYKIYTESFLSKEHLKKIIDEAQTIVSAAIKMK